MHGDYKTREAATPAALLPSMAMAIPLRAKELEGYTHEELCKLAHEAGRVIACEGDKLMFPTPATRIPEAWGPEERAGVENPKRPGWRRGTADVWADFITGFVCGLIVAAPQPMSFGGTRWFYDPKERRVKTCPDLRLLLPPLPEGLEGS